MNYQWARDFTLKLINQYSIAGNAVLESYNNQSDYLYRIPELIDDAQMIAATTHARIRKLVPISELEQENRGGWIVVKFPEDCWQPCGTGLIRLHDGQFQRFHRYYLAGDTELMLPPDVGGDLYLEYFRYPTLLGTKPADNAELDNTLAVQMALPYYAAAYLVRPDDKFAYAAFSNEFETKLARLSEPPQAEIHVVEHPYDDGAYSVSEY